MVLSGWHLSHLPVRLVGRRRAVQTIDKVVVSWPELTLAGFLLRPRPFFIPFVPAQGKTRLTDTGLVLESLQSIERKSRRWRRDTLQVAALYEKMPVYDSGNHLVGHVQDIAIDAAALQITHLVVTRGVLGDLLHGALLIPRRRVLSITPDKVKIHISREPLLLK
jgi:sporulation protein YlmC with PRC-barrel domain